MKYITLIIGLLVVGCGKQEQTLTLEEKVVGTYEIKKDGITRRAVLLDNGIFEFYKDGKKQEGEGKWLIGKEGELHITEQPAYIVVYRINKDGSITVIADILLRKREDIPKEDQWTYKKIK